MSSKITSSLLQAIRAREQGFISQNQFRETATTAMLNNLPVEELAALKIGAVLDIASSDTPNIDPRVSARRADIAARRLKESPIPLDKNLANTVTNSSLDDLRGACFGYPNCTPWSQYLGSSRTCRLFSALTIALSRMGIRENQEPQALPQLPQKNLASLSKSLSLLDLISCNEVARRDLLSLFPTIDPTVCKTIEELEKKLPNWLENMHFSDLLLSPGLPSSAEHPLYPATLSLEELASLPLSFFKQRPGTSAEVVEKQLELTIALLKGESLQPLKAPPNGDIEQLPVCILFQKECAQFFQASAELTPGVVRAIFANYMSALGEADLNLLSQDEKVFDGVFTKQMEKLLNQMSAEQLGKILRNSSDAIFKKITEAFFFNLKIKNLSSLETILDRIIKNRCEPSSLWRIVDNIISCNPQNQEESALQEKLLHRAWKYAISHPDSNTRDKDHIMLLQSILSGAWKINPSNALQQLVGPDLSGPPPNCIFIVRFNLFDTIVKLQGERAAPENIVDECLIPLLEALRSEVDTLNYAAEKKQSLKEDIVVYISKVKLSSSEGD